VQHYKVVLRGVKLVNGFGEHLIVTCKDEKLFPAGNMVACRRGVRNRRRVLLDEPIQRKVLKSLKVRFDVVIGRVWIQPTEFENEELWWADLEKACAQRSDNLLGTGGIRKSLRRNTFGKFRERRVLMQGASSVGRVEVCHE